MQNGLHGTKFLARLPWWNTCTTPRYSGCIHLKYSLRGAVQVFRYTTVVFSIPLGSPMERQSNRWIKKKNRIGSMDNSCFTWSEEQESCTIIEWYKKNTPASSDVSYVWCFVYDGGGCRGVRALTVDLKFEDERKITWTQKSRIYDVVLLMSLGRVSRESQCGVDTMDRILSCYVCVRVWIRMF